MVSPFGARFARHIKYLADHQIAMEFGVGFKQQSVPHSLHHNAPISLIIDVCLRNPEVFPESYSFAPYAFSTSITLVRPYLVAIINAVSPALVRTLTSAPFFQEKLHYFRTV